MKFSISPRELRNLLGVEKEYPKYATQLLNLANRFSQGTRRKQVGQMTELFKHWQKQTKDPTFSRWRNWYLREEPKGISNATKRIEAMLVNFRRVLDRIDRKTIKKWAEDLVITDTYIGLRVEEMTLKKLASKYGKKYVKSNPDEESKGIDGYIGGIPVSVKPISYKRQEIWVENIEASVIRYRKERGKIQVHVPGKLVRRFES